MKIDATPEEIAELVTELQTRLMEFDCTVEFPVPTWIFVVSWILFAIKVVGVFYTEYSGKLRP